MANRKTASAIAIASLLACAAPAKPAADWLLPVIAQAAPSFAVPESVPQGTQVRISSSSDNMNAISGALKQGFEGQYSGARVAIANKGADAAIQDVLNDNADLAAISRPLTDEEKAKGLIELPVRREKIAIVVGKGNAFTGSLTGSQFAQIFRGEVKDWSSVGGAAGGIRLIDRPATSETRQALRPYPVFQTAAFETGDNATALSEDTTDALVEALGTDGIGYVLVDQLKGQPDLRALQLHKTPPSDPRYPFSQPYSFVYAGGASPAVSAFLGYATGNPGQAAINGAGVSGVGLIPEAGGSATAAASNAAGTAGGAEGTDAAEGAASNGSSAEAGAGDGAEGAAGANAGTPNAGANGNTAGGEGTAGGESENDTAAVGGAAGEGDAGQDGTASAAAGETASPAAGSGRWWWLLLPLAGLGLLIWAAGKRGSEEEASYVASAGGEDDRIRSSFGVSDADLSNSGSSSGIDLPNTNLPEANLPGGAGLPSVSLKAPNIEGSGIGKAVAGGAALAGGAAAAGAGLAGRFKDETADLAADLKDGASDSLSVGDVQASANSAHANVRAGLQDGVEEVKGTAQSGLGNLRSNIHEGIDGLKDRVRGNADGLEGDARIGIEGDRPISPSLNDISGPSSSGPDSWLDRAKKRINEATEQLKETTADIKDDRTKD